ECERPPADVLRPLPSQVEMHAFDRGVTGCHRVGSVRLPPGRRVVLAGPDHEVAPGRGEVRQKSPDQLDLGHPPSASLNRRASASGSAASASERMAQTLVTPAARSSGKSRRSMPPIAKTGMTTAPATAATP